MDRELEQFFLRKIIPSLGSILGRLLPIFQKNLGWTTDHVLALVHELGISLAHLVPDASQRIVGQEFNDVAGCEELITEGQFVGVARSLTPSPFRISGCVSQFLGREILVDPAYDFVLRPN